MTHFLLAADVATTVDLSPVVSYLALFLVTLIGGVVTWALNKYFGIKISAQAQGTLETAMTNGLALATSKLAPNGLTIDTKSAVVAQAANYVIAHAPEAAAKFGLDSDPKALAEKLEARLVQTVAAATVSPATAAPPPVVAVPVTPAA